MSEHPRIRRNPRPRRLPHTDRDAGNTLPEVLVAVVVTGLLVAAMAAAASVVIRQGDNTTGRLNNARSEQSAGSFMPSDLASAEKVDDTASAKPCGSDMPPCPTNVNLSGSNTLMLTWTNSVAGSLSATPTTTKVSYRYIQTSTGEYQIIRVMCVSGGTTSACTQTVVLHNELPPPAGVEYYPGTTKPTWVLLVTLAVDPAAPGDGTDLGLSGNGNTLDPTYYYREGRRVSVTINGGGDISGAGGGSDQITLTAGGTRRDASLSTTNLTASPTFAATRSRCGGNFGLIVDTSGSIGSNMSYVRTGITAFINAFAGTPIKLQVVSFSSTATTLGAGSSWSKYYDMLSTSDVSALKTLVTGLNSSGATNWEDAFFRMFQNNDGSVQQVLPSTLIFFTDGIPDYSRLNATSATASPAVASNDDSGLPAANGSSYNQTSWNRANRIARTFEADLQKFIGVFVGVDTAGTSTWIDQGAGYHLTNFLQGYHDTYQQGYHYTNVQRGYHLAYTYATTGMTYQYAGSGLTYQYSTTGLTYEYAASGMTFQHKSGSTWSTTPAATYFANNTTTDSTDNYRINITGTLGTWTSINANAATAKSQYDLSNTTNDSTDGIRVRVSGTVGPAWNSISGSSSTAKALFDLSNTTNDSTDGYRIVVGSPSSWTTTTKAYYDLNNAVAGPSDGFQTVASSPGGFTATTLAYYNLNNTTADSTDGFAATNTYSSPYDSWENTTDALYLANNTTADNTDGWTATTVYSAPYTYWATTTQAAYTAGNTTADNTDGWQDTHVYSSPFTGWDPTTEAAYTAGNTTAPPDKTDGWDATKSYTEPYTFHEGYASYSKTNSAILQQIVAPGGVVPAQLSGSTYTNAGVATFYQLPLWTQFTNAMTSMALAECGGTVTLQTKIGSSAAPDPFTYQNSVDKSTATTSAQYHSGTFDFNLAGGVSQVTTLTPINTSNLTMYNPVSWSCTAAGAAYPFTTALVNGGPWSSITLTVSPNQAVSCVYTVALK